jgi:hypothetical protein
VTVGEVEASDHGLMRDGHLGQIPNGCNDSRGNALLEVSGDVQFVVLLLVVLSL